MRQASILLLLLLEAFALPGHLMAQWQSNGTYLERGACEGEGCRIAFLAVVKRPALVYSRRDGGTVVWRLRTRDSIEVERVDIVHHSLTRVVARRPVVIEPESGNPIDTLMPGDTLKVLSYAGEGWHRALGEDFIRRVPEFWKDPHLLGEYPDTFPARIVTQGKYVVWYLVKYAPGKRGWVKGHDWIADELEVD